ncbi:MAG: M50 family metallopeptidase [Eubacteriaceae bacterium]|nr:M50 family metallopeptidase [Eubacteriaceae bacterium]
MQNGKKKQKTENRGQWISILIYMFIGASCGVLILMYLEQQDQSGNSLPAFYLSLSLMIIGMYIAMIIQIIIHEAGHLIFGLLTGYRFSSFRIFNLMLIKQDGRVQFRKLSIAGTGGQCLMIPPDLKGGEMPVMLYNFGGAIINLFTAVLCFGLSFLCPIRSLIWTILLIFAVIGLAFALMNGLPVKMGPVNNDGMNALDLSRSKEAIRAFWIQMKVNEQISKGIRLKEMPDEWFTLPSDESMENGIIATVGVLACNRLMDQHLFEEADTLIKQLLSGQNGIVSLHRNLMICDRMYVEMISENRKEILEEMLSDDLRNIMKVMKTYPSVLRTEYLYALLVEKDKEKAEKAMVKFDRCAKAYPYPIEIEGERELITLAERLDHITN